MADSRAKDMVVRTRRAREWTGRDGEGANKVFYSNSITGRPLLNGLSVTFLIWTVACLAKDPVYAFHLPPGRADKGKASDCVLFHDFRLMDQKNFD